MAPQRVEEVEHRRGIVRRALEWIVLRTTSTEDIKRYHATYVSMTKDARKFLDAAIKTNSEDVRNRAHAHLADVLSRTRQYENELHRRGIRIHTTRGD